jgi:hypothetical protein
MIHARSIAMNALASAALLTAAIGSLAALAAPAVAQVKLTPGFTNPKITFWNRKDDGPYWTTTDGGKPMAASRTKVRDGMVKRRVLEEYAEFLSPLHLPRTLRIMASDCDGGDFDSPYYSRTDKAMTICYSYVGLTEQMADDVTRNTAKVKRWIPTTRDQLVAGEFAATVLHETGHALFDILEIPVFGREEDGADQVEAYLALQFGPDIARTIIKADAYFYEWTTTDPKTFKGFSDPHDVDSQRMYNLLCIGYGGQRAAFQDLVTSGWLPKERADGCDKEYAQLDRAFKRTVGPYIDQAQMAKVKARKDWFSAAELRDK